MLAKISGRVTNIREFKTKTGKSYYSVKLMQLDKEGNACTVPVKFWDAKRVQDIKKDALLEVEGNVQGYVSKQGFALISVTVW